MATLTRAHEELFKRTPDERYATLPELIDHCKTTREASQDRWLNHDQITITSDMNVVLDGDPDHQFCDWSFSQLCQMAGGRTRSVPVGMGQVESGVAPRPLREG